jgi:16S rRNA (cytidine1402-2'-O)-methyltransferase
MLYIVATPIGNLEDISSRALRVLGEADVIACEDTRRTRALLTHFEIPRPASFVSYREQTEKRGGGRLVSALKEGKTVVLCTDGGYPGISDPGYRLIRQAIDEGIEFQVVPGASAVAVSLLISGLSSSSYTFKGYPPRKKGALRRFFEEEKNMPHSLVVFESPFRTAATLGVALEVLGDRQAAVCVELTKKFERVMRGFLSELTAELGGRPLKGEVTVVIAGNNPKFMRQAHATVNAEPGTGLAQQ